MVREVAAMTCDNAGDGTTTATVPAQTIIQTGLKNVTAVSNPLELKRGIDKAVVAVVEELRNQSQPVGDSLDSIRQAGTISANVDEEIGAYIAEAMEKVGKDRSEERRVVK